MIYLLDTMVASAVMREALKVAQHLAALAESDDIAVSSITRGEIYFGIARLSEGKRRSHLATKANQLFEHVLCVPVDESVADAYAELKAELEGSGRPIGKENDLWIAAVALAKGFTLVSEQGSFGHVPNLKVENWMT